MILNFSGMNDKKIKATIVHQFGHALGLGHALMKPDVWRLLKPLVNLNEMMNSLAVHSVSDLEKLWCGKGLRQRNLNYDEESVMHYR
jgi:predicted Zn-dependent protease with MMP-like domain